MNSCPCGSNKDYKICCQPYITGKGSPPTAELLMRARYTAYTLGEIDFIIETHAPDTRDETSKDDISKWSHSSQWKSLQILKIKGGKVRDKKGTVEFKALYHSSGNEHIHHEKSSFIKKSGTWYYKGWVE